MSPLTEWQVEKLKSINFLFEKKIDADWEQSFKKYKPLIIKYKGKIPESEKTLKRWISKQRSDYKDKKLDEEKIEELVSIKYWSWDPFKDRFEHNLQKLELLLPVDYLHKLKMFEIF